MKITKPLLITGALLAIATPASAHEGEHAAPFLANVLHWLSSPTHALLSVVSAAVLITVVAAMRRRRS